MNRSILIVICDFLVLSAMSLSMGLSKSSEKGPGVTESIRPVTHVVLIQQMEQLAAQAKSAETKNAALSQKLAEQADRIAKMDAEGKEKSASNEKMKAELIAANDRLAKQKAALDATEKQKGALSADLAATKGNLQATKANLEKSEGALRQTKLTLEEEKKALALSRQVLAEQSKTLQQTQKNLDDKGAELAKTLQKIEEQSAAIKANQKLINDKNAELFRAEIIFTQKKEELEKTEKDRIALTAELERKKKEVEDSKILRAHTEGQLAQANKEIEVLNRKIGSDMAKMKALESDLRTSEINRGKLEVRLDEEQKKGAVLQTELVQTKDTVEKQKNDLNKAKNDIVAKDQALQKTSADLKEAKRKLQNDALMSYTNAVMPLAFSIQNTRVFNSFDYKTTFYLPLVQLSNRTFLPASVESVTGLTSLGNGYTTVADLSYKLKDGTALQGPIYSLAEDPRVALLEVKATPDRKPLTVITAAALRKRGLDNMTLFKAGKNGIDSASLTNRCSMQPDQDQFLMIRNSLRSSSEIPAEIGDFVITKEGEFAGIVVRVVPDPAQGRSDAYCWIFQQSLNLEKAAVIPLTKKEGKNPFADFVSELTRIHNQITEMNRQPVK